MELSRREVVKGAGGLAAVAAVSNLGFISGKAFAAGTPDRPLRIGLIGCGGRGTGAVGDALSSSENVVLTVMGDIDAAPLKSSYDSLKSWEAKGKFAVKEENKFVGYDAIDKVCSHPEVDLVIQTTPPGLRYLTLRKAIENGKHSFVEKPICVDAWTYNHVLESGKMAAAKGLSIACGLQYRYENSYKALIEKLNGGAIGEIVSAQSYYQAGIPWITRSWTDKKLGQDDMDYQMRNWLSFNWLSGDCICEQDVHSIDAVVWALGGPPVDAYANGGRQEPIRDGVGDGFDTFSVDYKFINKEGNEVQVAFYGRQINGVDNKVFNRIIGTKGYAVIFPNPGASRCMIFEHGKKDPVWKYEGEMNQPYQTEHAENIAAIRAGKPLNDTQMVADSSFTAVLGRESAFSGKRLDWNALVKTNFRIGTDLLAPGKVQLPVKGVRTPGQYKVKGYAEIVELSKAQADLAAATKAGKPAPVLKVMQNKVDAAQKKVNAVK